MLTRLALCVIVLAAFPAGMAAAEEPLFPFVISYDAPDNVTNVSGWLERPAGGQGFVRVADGHLATDAGRIRFWATNLCFEACFASPEQAQRLAARLARLGINCVRMHHMDSGPIWGSGHDKLSIDPQKLKRLDYLVYQLKLHGIYTDLNLHVGRWLGPAEGFGAQQGRPTYDKGLDNFEPRMIELQKKYARDLLTHVNPYTKTPYTQEPAVAFVEISNEDALFAVWNGGQIDDLPEPYATTFRKLWNAWLRKKYGDGQRLRKQWNVGEWPLGEEMLRDGDFAAPPAENWGLERDDRTGVEWSVRGEGPDGRRCLRIEVTRQGRVAWRPQLSQGGFALKKGAPYTLSCKLRADSKRRIGVNCMMAHEPWQRLGLAVDAELGPSWKPFHWTFLAERDDANARITFTDLRPGRYELADVSLRPGGVVGLTAGERLENDTVPVLRHGDLSLTAAARRDFVDFLWETERDYWQGMYRFLKDELGVRSLVSGTQLSYSPAHVQAGLDYIDAHAYWQHPHFPGRPWDPVNWQVHNVPLVNTPGGTLASLACRRVSGMAYTVSEYNHPAPNVYAAEGFPMIAAFGAFQGWDGIFSFTYSHDAKFEPRRITGFFDLKGDTAKLAHLPACAALFLRGDAAAALQTVLVPMSADAERQTLYETLSAWGLTADGFGLDPLVSLLHGVALELDQQPSQRLPTVPPGTKVFVCDTGQIRWDVSQQGAGFFIANTPRSKFFSGFVRGRQFDLGKVRLKIGHTRLDWATVSMVAIDGQDLDASAPARPGRVLIAATGWVQNRDAQLKHLEDDQVTLGNQWGSEPVLCEGIPAEITWPASADRVSFYPLDEAGNRRPALPCRGRDGRTLLELGPQHKTVWYEVQVR